jgi:hypothetical protein
MQFCLNRYSQAYGRRQVAKAKKQDKNIKTTLDVTIRYVSSPDGEERISQAISILLSHEADSPSREGIIQKNRNSLEES